MYCVMTPMRRMPEFMQLDKREIDDAELAAEIDRRLGAAVGQILQSAATPSCEHQRHGAPGQVQALGYIDRLIVFS